MTLLDKEELRMEELAIFIVSPDEKLRLKLEAEVRNLGLPYPTTIESFSEMEEATGERASAVLIDADHFDPTSPPLYTCLQQIKRQYPETVLVCLVGVLTYDAAQPVLVGGFDLALSRDNPANAVVNAVGAVRHVHSIVTGRRVEHVRSTPSGEHIGDWTLVPWRRSVRLPNQTEVRLTETEWIYLEFLVHRDVSQTELPSEMHNEVGGRHRQNALVYKLKKKLGPDFPIVAAGSGSYKIDPRLRNLRSNAE